MQEIRDTYYRLLGQTTPLHTRYLFSRLDGSRRLVGLVGPRGVGKTTLMLQWIRLKENAERCMYASLDHIYFSAHSLLDFIRDMHQTEGRTHFFLDEVHMYPGWNRELKNIHDAYPEIHIVFSGSSSLDLVRGQYDLSRRGIVHRMNGLSLREYLQFKTGHATEAIPLEDLLNRRVEISRELSAIPRIRGLFEEYLRVGYYPFYFEDPETYYPRILNTIGKTVFEDIANFYSLSTSNLPLFKKLLAYLASNPPGEINVNALARNVGIDHKTVNAYLEMLQETSLTHSLRLDRGGNAGLRSPDKILLENANLYFAIATESGFSPNAGSLRETFFVNAMRGTGLPVHYSKEGDYSALGNVFEIGGKSKSRRQIRDTPKAILVKEGPMIASPGEIPLYLFGFLW